MIESNSGAVALHERLAFRHERWRREVPPDDVRGLRLGADGAALVRETGGRVSVVQLAARDVASAEALLATARALGDSVHYVNVPEGDPASAALQGLGATLDLRQREMALVR